MSESKVEVEERGVKRQVEETGVKRQALKLSECFCHIPYLTFDSKSSGVTFIKCGQTRKTMKDGASPCTLFCQEDEDWPLIFQALKTRYKDGLNFTEDFPECGHSLKCRVSATKAKTGCYFACRLTCEDPDMRCDYIEWVNKKPEGAVRKRRKMMKKAD